MMYFSIALHDSFVYIVDIYVMVVRCSQFALGFRIIGILYGIFIALCGGGNLCFGHLSCLLSRDFFYGGVVGAFSIGTVLSKQHIGYARCFTCSAS